MAQRSGFFNGKMLRDPSGLPLLHEDGSPRFDREYTAAEFAEMFSLYLTNGIRNGGNNLRVVADNAMFVRVLPGDAMINGYFYRLVDDGVVFQVEQNFAGTPRVDRVVLRLDLRQEEGRIISLALKRGDATLTRNNEIWELALADISVALGIGGLTQAQITDRRLDPELCGLIHSLVAIDTSGLLAQLDSWFAQQKEIWEGQTGEYVSWFEGTSNHWNGWFNHIRAELFAQGNTFFEDWSRRAGLTYETEFLPPDENGTRIVETLLNTISRVVFARRTTLFDVTGKEINESLWFNEPAIHVGRTTTFSEDKVIEVVVELPQPCEPCEPAEPVEPAEPADGDEE